MKTLRVMAIPIWVLVLLMDFVAPHPRVALILSDITLLALAVGAVVWCKDWEEWLSRWKNKQ